MVHWAREFCIAWLKDLLFYVKFVVTSTNFLFSFLILSLVCVLLDFVTTKNQSLVSEIQTCWLRLCYWRHMEKLCAFGVGWGILLSSFQESLDSSSCHDSKTLCMCRVNVWDCSQRLPKSCVNYSSVSKLPGHGINYTGQREFRLEVK